MPCGLLLVLVLHIEIARKSQVVSSQLTFKIKYNLDFTRDLVVK